MIESGTRVKAKRLGWNEVLTPEQEYDMEPYEYEGSNNIEGILEIVEIDSSVVGKLTIYLVGGQEADPNTIEPRD